MTDNYDPTIHGNPHSQEPEPRAKQTQAEFDQRLDEAIHDVGEQFGQHLREQAASPDPVAHAINAAAKMKTRRLNPRAARERRAKRNETFEFILHSTTDEEGNPQSVLAMRPSLFEAEDLSQLPRHMQETVFDLFNKTQSAEGDDGPGTMDTGGLNTADAFGIAVVMADAACIKGFVDPKCYATAEEADRNDGVWVKDIDWSDRLAFFNECQGKQREAAAAVDRFPDQPVDAVHDGQPGNAVSGAGQSEPRPEAGRTIPPPRDE